MAKTPVARRPGPVSAPSRMTPAETVTEPSPASAPTASTPTEPELTRLSLPYDPSTGTIAWSRMRDSTKEQIRKALANDPNAARELGNTTSAATAANTASDPALDALIVNVLYDAIGSLAVVLARSKGYPADAAAVLRYTDDEKKMLAPPTIKVLAKYDILGGRYADEIALLVAVGSITAAHIVALNTASAPTALGRVS